MCVCVCHNIYRGKGVAHSSRCRRSGILAIAAGVVVVVRWWPKPNNGADHYRPAAAAEAHPPPHPTVFHRRLPSVSVSIVGPFKRHDNRAVTRRPLSITINSTLARLVSLHTHVCVCVDTRMESTKKIPRQDYSCFKEIEKLLCHSVPSGLATWQYRRRSPW